MNDPQFQEIQFTASVLPPLPVGSAEIDLSRISRANPVASPQLVARAEQTMRNNAAYAIRVASLDPALSPHLTKTAMAIAGDFRVRDARYSFDEQTKKWTLQVHPLTALNKEKLAGSLLLFLSAKRAGQKLYGDKQPEQDSRFDRMKFGQQVDEFLTTSSRTIGSALLKSGDAKERQLGETILNRR